MGQVTIGGMAAGVTIPVTLRISSNDLIIPQVADGSGWSTEIALVNTDLQPASYTLKFWKPDGNPLPINLEGIGVVSEYSDTIPTGGRQTLNTLGSDPALSQGWAEVIAQGSIGGTAVFSQTGVTADSEAAAPATPPLGKAFSLPFDNSAGFQTGVSVVNTGPAESALSVVLCDQNGNRVVSDSITLPPHGSTAFFLQNRYPQLRNLRGAAEFSSSNTDVSALG